MMHLILAIIAVVLIAYGGYELYLNEGGGDIAKHTLTKKKAMMVLVLGLLAGAGSAYCYSESKDM